MAMRGAQIGGHPLHPKVVGFPIAFWMAAFVGDIAYLVTGNLFWYSFAFVNLGLGILTALPAAVLGTIDYFAVRGKTRAKRIGLIHMAFNTAALVLFLSTFVFRFDAAGGFFIPPEAALTGGPLYAAVALSFFGVILLGAGGWLGGELVYREGIGVRRGEPGPEAQPPAAGKTTQRTPPAPPDRGRKPGRHEDDRPGGDQFH
jgi:uncharacterized membrane protein